MRGSEKQSQLPRRHDPPAAQGCKRLQQDAEGRGGHGGKGALLAKGALPGVKAWCLRLLHAQAKRSVPAAGRALLTAPASGLTAASASSGLPSTATDTGAGTRAPGVTWRSRVTEEGVRTPSSWGLKPPTRDQTPPSASGHGVPPTGPPGKSSTSNFLFVKSPTPF